MAERWLVISHEATNSGAPRMLLRLLQEVRARRPDLVFEFLFRHGGALLSEFAELGPRHVLTHPSAEGRSLRARLVWRFADAPLLQPRRLARWLRDHAATRFDLVYNNTVTNAALLPAARSFGCPILTHVHELGYSMRRFNTAAALAQTWATTDHFIAVSPPVADDLIAQGVVPTKITTVPNFLRTLPAAPQPTAHVESRRRLGLPPDAWVVVGCGHIDRVKGTDFFVTIASDLRRRANCPVRFLWIGDAQDRAFARRLQRQVRAQGLSEVVRFVGPVDNPGDHFLASDVVLITSRAESFSLVALEAAALERPVVGFAGARGLATVLGERTECLAPEHDVSALGDRALALLQNPALANALGQDLRQRVAEEFLAERRVGEILDVVEKLRRSRARRA